MSELDHCIRGCMRPCSCDACGSIPIHDPVPRQATDGQLCAHCGERLLGWLREIPDLYATLDPYESPATDATERHKRTKLSGSPALARVDVLSLLDRRTTAMSKVGPDGKREPDNGLMDVAGVINSWALLLVEEESLSSPVDTLVRSVGVLTAWWSTLARMPWIGEMYTDVKAVRSALGRANGEVKPRPVGRCLAVYEREGEWVDCRRTLYAPETGVTIRCRSCGRTYNGRDLVLVRLEAARGGA